MRKPYAEVNPSEESVLFWLWAWHRLLGWSRSISWLRSPIVDPRSKSPGYLAGVDSTGSLILVNTIIERGAALDPFESFSAYIKNASINGDLTAEVLHAKWLNYAARDEDFFESQLARFWLAIPTLGTYGRAARPIRLVYSTSIAPLLRDGTYEQSMKRYLDLRDSIGNPPPVVFGVVVSPRSDFRFWQKAQRASVPLQRQVGRDRVVLRALSAILNSRGLRVNCQTLDVD